MNPNTYQPYRATAVRTASPGQLILMLYDGAIRFLERAVLAFSNDDPLEFNQTIHNNITRAQQIIEELNASLNMDAGGDFAANQRRLYFYFDEVLHRSNVQKDLAGIQDVLRRLGILRNAWAEMLANQQQPTSRPGGHAPFSIVG